MPALQLLKKASFVIKTRLNFFKTDNFAYSPEFDARFVGGAVGCGRKGVGVRSGVGVVRGVAVGDGRAGVGVPVVVFVLFSLGDGDGDGLGLGLGLGFGVGVGVRRFAFALVLMFAFRFVSVFELALKLKFPRLIFVLTLVSVAGIVRLELTFVLLLAGASFCKNQKTPAPAASTAIVPKIVKTTTFAVFGFGGGG